METERLRGKWIGHFSTVFNFCEQIIQRMLFWVIKPDTVLPSPPETPVPSYLGDSSSFSSGTLGVHVFLIIRYVLYDNQIIPRWASVGVLSRVTVLFLPSCLSVSAPSVCLCLCLWLSVAFWIKYKLLISTLAFALPTWLLLSLPVGSLPLPALLLRDGLLLAPVLLATSRRLQLEQSKANKGNCFLSRYSRI